METPTKTEQAKMRSESGETYVDKVKKGPSEKKTGTSGGGLTLRPILPRVSKTNHKVFPGSLGKEVDNPGTLGKRPRKSSQ